MKHLQKLFLAGHLVIVALFFCSALALVVLAGSELWHGVLRAGTDAGLRIRFDSILEAIGMLTIGLVALVVLAGSELWHGVLRAGTDAGLRIRFDSILEAIGMLTIGLVALELAQTVFEEEVQRDVKVSGPTRVRRYLSRFLVVIVIALSIETLVATFELMHEDPTKLPYVAAIGGSAAMLLLAWGGFVRLNRSAEELEPEAMEQAKSEDRKVD